MKRPSFQFYPRDWQTDLELRSCSASARALWMDMLCMMHFAEPYGHLLINGKRMTDAQIVNAVSGVQPKHLAELEQAGVFSRTDDGTIYSRRMVRDESLRNVRADGGQLGAEYGAKGAAFGVKGGRPRKVEGAEKPPFTEPEKPPLKPPPASAVASASATASKTAVVESPTDTARVNGSHTAIENIENSTAKTVVQVWWKSDQGVAATAKTVGIERHVNESDSDFKDRVYVAVEARKRRDRAEASNREKQGAA